MNKAITVKDIIDSIEYITIIDGKESKPSYGVVWSTWNEQITRESEEFFGYKPEKEFDPVARDNYQKYIAMSYYAGQIPAKIVETRTNEIDENGCYIFTVETFGSLKLDQEETKEDGAKEAETKTEAHTVNGVFADSAFGGVEVSLDDCNGEALYYRFNYGDPGKWHKVKIYETAAGRAFFRANGRRIYLDEVMRV